jgi:hypothetical protein
LIVPINGAQVIVTGPPAGVASVEAWIKEERMNYSIEDHTSQVQIQVGSKLIGATVVRSQPRVIPDGTMAIYLFEFNDRLLKASTLYRSRSPSKHFEDVLVAIIQGFEVEQ